jgi:hypothetical protein
LSKNVVESIRCNEYNIINDLINSWEREMEYLTTKELSEKWKISQRRIQIYCKENRIHGAILKGSIWLIPENAQKPQDPRKKHAKE